MSKINKRVRRADAANISDHRHKLPDGSYTSGALNKPNKDQFDMHTHLYEFNEDTLETDPMHNFGDHTHGSRLGESSGPSPMQKKPGEPWQKMDSIEREGRSFVLRDGDSGSVIARGATPQSVVAHCDSADADEILKRYRAS
jgi:hypothetical protein